MKKYNVAILGATGMVGQEMLKILDQRNFPINNLKLTASERTSGRKIQFRGKEYEVEVATPDAFKDIDIVLSSAGAGVSRELAPSIIKHGAVIIDNTSAFRMDEDVPLVVPEINAHALKNHKGIIANPNCSTIQLVMALKPLNDFIPMKRVIVSTYQSVSGAGKEAVEEMYGQLKGMLENNYQKAEKTILPQVIAMNVIPHGGTFLDNDYTDEEIKVTNETRKIMELPNLAIAATSVRVPVVTGHSETVNIEFEQPLEASKAKELMANFPGVIVMDDPKTHSYPMALDIAGKDEVFVGRIRQDISHPNALNMWVVADNIRKGAALNAVQIAEKMIEMELI
ncbi:aspartate-semialdehyde dehydrogenase [bacterium]|nr:MAG: aspartate-semialdehyde dehydrogenase [bacterium]